MIQTTKSRKFDKALELSPSINYHNLPTISLNGPKCQPKHQKENEGNVTSKILSSGKRTKVFISLITNNQITD